MTMTWSLILHSGSHRSSDRMWSHDVWPSPGVRSNARGLSEERSRRRRVDIIAPHVTENANHDKIHLIVSSSPPPLLAGEEVGVGVGVAVVHLVSHGLVHVVHIETALQQRLHSTRPAANTE